MTRPVFRLLPGLHDSTGKDIPGVRWRKSDIYLRNDYRTSEYQPSQQLQHVDTLIPDPAKTIGEEPCTNRQNQDEQITQAITKLTAIPTALGLARQLAGADRHLASALSLSHGKERTWANERHRLQEEAGVSQLARGPDQIPLPPNVPSQVDVPSEQHDLSDASSGSQTDEIPNPPIPGNPAPSVDSLLTQVNHFAKAHGFGAVKANGMVRPGQRSRYIFQCDRYGTPRPGRGAGLRKRKSRKLGCLWKIIAEALPQNNFQWTLRHFPELQHHQHNHRRSADAAAHPVHRRLTSLVKATIQSTSRRVGIRARDIGGIVRDHFPDSVYVPRDIYNARARINRENLGCYSSTAALIRLFDEKGIPYIAEWDRDEPDRLVGLVWTFPYCLRMWKRFSEVISFDNTYNTNRFKLPLFQVTGQTCLGTVFNAAFGLIDNERLEGFQFLAKGVRALLSRDGIRTPDVVITDFDKQMKLALGGEFAEAQQQICIHHINSNVMLQSKRRWVYATRDRVASEEGGSGSDEHDADLNDRDWQAVQESERQEEPITRDNSPQSVTHDYNGVLMLWRLVVFAETEEDHEKAWECLCTQFSDQKAILAYLYIPPSRPPPGSNFGIRVTSGTEAGNNNVKSYLLNGMSHLYRLVEAIQGMLEDQEREFRQACAQDEVLTAREHLGRGSEYLGDIPHVVSQKGLSMMTREYRKALKGIPSPSNPWPDAITTCNDDCNVSIELGIPCHHTLYRKLVTAVPLTKWDIHSRWHLREPVTRDVYRRILDPKIATNLRGRPKNKPQPIPTSMAVGSSRQTASRRVSGTQPQSSRSQHRGQSCGGRSLGRRLEYGQADRGHSQACEDDGVNGNYLVPGRQFLQPKRGLQQPKLKVLEDMPFEVPGIALAITLCFRTSFTVSRITGFNRKSKGGPKFAFDDGCNTTSTHCYSCAPATHVTCSYDHAFAQSASMFTAQEYRRAMGLPLRYDRTSYAWCLDDEQMSRLCTTTTGKREWTKEEMMAYLDWTKAGNGHTTEQVVAETAGNETPRSKGRGERNAKEQDALYSAGREEQCIVVKL
ncbi:transposase [Pochonia chlamydosporia 170]|uniref:Transposase n=1 Tax=Pochonia chlamydosporia 170 TaxID=1380566 RepID=A0A219AQI5_METCM|nr:transposase [Pochonia chlamydosporia 170]OWT43046.1 transposase [Pochonia chlamydosporia 170]